MGKAKKTRKFAVMKKMISLKDSRIQKNGPEQKDPKKQNGVFAPETDSLNVKTHEATPSALFLNFNTSLGPPYHILLDTNYVNFVIKRKLDIFQSFMDTLYGKCILYVTDCVMGEVEKMSEKFRVALRILHDPRIKRLTCLHKGTYADDCLVERVRTHRCYLVATCDRDLRRRLRKVPGVPILYLHGHRVTVERMPDCLGAPKV